MSFDLLKQEVENGISGLNSGIPMGFNRLNKYIGIRKRIYTTVFGGTGCHTQGTKVLLSNGSYTTVEKVNESDLLMGPDSTPRKVLELKRGFGKIYKIIQNKGITYSVNEDHILRLRKYTKGNFSYINITVKDYLLKSNKFKHLWKCYKVAIDFPEQHLDFDPYFLGLWLGDGTSCKTEITTNDTEIIQYLSEFCDKYDLLLNRHKKDGYNYNIVGRFGRGKDSTNYLIHYLKKENLLCNKHITNKLLYNSRKNRLLLLAGLLDSDGFKDRGSYEIVAKNENLAKQIVFLSRSLGFYTSIIKKVATMKRKDGSIYKCDVYRIGINGNNLIDIPCKIERKKHKTISTRVSDALSTGFKVEQIEDANYYGFVLDKDSLYLLEDLTVTHNTGKSALVHNAYILQPFDYLRKHPDNSIKMKVILFSMERGKIYILAKWLSREIFLSEGILIPVSKLLGWWDTKLTKDEHDLFLAYGDYINEVCEFCDIIEHGQNPTGIYKYIKKYAEDHGRFEQIDEYNRVYVPDHPNEIVVPIVDHFGLTKPEKTMSKKEAIEKVSEYFQYFRDGLGYSPVGVSQINRELGSYGNKKDNNLEPTLDHIKESGRPAEDSDNVISLFQPSHYKTEDINYKVDKFIDPSTGGDYFRSLKILKNSFGEADIRCGMAFMGSVGIFKELKKPKEMDDFNYSSLFNNSYFLE